MPALFYSLRFRLSLLVLLAMLPLLGLTLYLGIQEQDMARREAQNDMLHLANLAAEGQTAFIVSARQLLFVLSLAPEIQQPEACHTYLALILAKTEGLDNLGVINANGDYRCSAAAGATPINAADRPYFQEAVRTGAFTIGQYQVSRVTNTSILNFALPVKGEDGAVKQVLVASMDLVWLDTYLHSLNLSPDESVLVIDRAGALLGRIPPRRDLVGQTFPDAPVVQALLGSQGEGTIETAGLDGVQRIYGYKALGEGASARIYVAVGVPSADAFALANQRAAASLGGLGLMTLLALAASWFFGDLFLVRSARRLVSTTHRLSAGELSARTGLAYDPSEPGRLARAIDEMAASLERSTANLTVANRTLRMISDCSQAMGRAQNEPELLDAICRILVETGGYRMAWVGLAENDPPHAVRPVASAGHVEGYLDGLDIRWDDVPMGRGPTGTAIRTRQVVVAQDFATNPLMAPWRQRALERGYAASIALPLIAESEALGALMAYSTGPQAFQPPEVTLLEELAGDLAYGIQALRARAGRLAAQEELQASEQRFRSAFENAAIGMTLTSLDGRLIKVNRSYCQMLGYSPAELEGVELSAITHPDDQTVTYNVLRGGPDGNGDVIHFEKRYLHRDGQIVWAFVSTFLLRNAAGERMYFITQVQDITARKKADEDLLHLAAELEQRVEQRTAELKEKNRELETFAYSVSHDLKAPLRGIDGYSRLLLSDYAADLNEEARAFLTSIRRASQQMDDLIDDLLAYSRLERRTLANASLNLRQVAESVVSEFERTLEEGPVELSLDLDDVWVMADFESLSQALRNLVDNAIKFSAASTPPRIQIRTWQSEGSGFLCVRDNGIGFEMRYHDRIFEIFQRLHRSEDYPGTGVGLAIVHKAMERLKGRAWAESAPGEGATFYLEIPCER